MAVLVSNTKRLLHRLTGAFRDVQKISFRSEE